MITRTRLRTVTVPALMVSLSLLAAPRSVHAGNSLAGHWQATSYVHCDPNPANAAICQRLLLALGTFSQRESYTSDAAGNVRYVGLQLARSAAPIGAAHRCTPYIIVQPFSGVCVVIHHGSAVIKASGSLQGLPVFVENDETATYYGPGGPLTVVDPLNAPLALVGVPSAYPLDTGIPAVPGYYETGTYLKLLGYTGSSAGVTVNVRVTQLS